MREKVYRQVYASRKKRGTVYKTAERENEAKEWREKTQAERREL